MLTLLSQKNTSMILLPPLVEELCEAQEELFAISGRSNTCKETKYTSSLLRCPSAMSADQSRLPAGVGRMLEVGCGVSFPNLLVG